MIRRTTLTLFAALLSGAAFAETNIAVVNFEAVIAKSTKATAALGRVDGFRKEKQAELQAMADSLQGQQRDAQARSASMSETERREVAGKLQRLQTEITRKTEDAEREVQLRTNTALAELDKKLGPLVRDLAKEKNIHLVLQYGAEVGVVFVDSTIDITDEVAARYDALP